MNSAPETVETLERLRERALIALESQNDVVGLRIVLIDVCLAISNCSPTGFDEETIKSLRRMFTQIRTRYKQLYAMDSFDKSDLMWIAQHIETVILKLKLGI
ncbi:hypothetical protein DRW42_00075 [Pedobacter miscanthi]|uniref:Uncharacterized protein n=1 Tax=Pedobacter miscanthi TaxID=2259170 RepID=A0A366LEL1_9SPHI|nr:hypothetical protein DRW42_00075 [Pedobacter miscanthi]